MNQDFREFIQSLNDNDVDYLVIGGYAVAFHGHPRYTKDLDIGLRLTKDNVQRLLNALDDFGFSSQDLRVEDFLNPDEVVQLGQPPNRIDLLTEVQGVDFDNCYQRRVEEDFNGVVVKFIDLENLRKNKKAAGRHQDLADLDHLE
ncbi:hypothetical protein MJD09_05825 [bacterium]|nr:hypothetical protein [bacterium]